MTSAKETARSGSFSSWYKDFMTKAVIFDLDGTMYDYDHCNEVAMEALRSYCAAHFNLRGEEFASLHAKAFRESADRVGCVSAASHNRLIRYQCMLEMIGQPLFPYALEMYHCYWDTMLDVMQPYEGLIDWISKLRAEGIVIGVGTNMTAYIQYKKLERLQTAPLVDFIVTSEEVGVEKPEAKLFEACVRKSACPAGDCLYVGDSLQNDAYGASAVGMKALLFDPAGKARGEYPFPVIHSFTECLRKTADR